MFGSEGGILERGQGGLSSISILTEGLDPARLPNLVPGVVSP